MAVAKSGEMAASAVASKAKALVEAKYVIALQRPRSINDARAAILDACKRERFAESALYRKPVGKKQINGRWEEQFIDGLSIRFAETAIQAMKNICIESVTTYEDDEKRTVNISVTDLESNLSYGKDVTISKTVERRKLKDGQSALSERTNSYGDKVYIVAATEDEIANKIAAQESKVIRNSGLRLVPQDILAEAFDTIVETQENGGTDPAAETKKICDAFTAQNVRPAELEKYLGHTLATVSKKELIQLRAIYATIKDGEASWAEYVKEKEAAEAAKPIFTEKPADNSNADLAPAKGKEKVEKAAKVESVKTAEPAKQSKESPAPEGAQNARDGVRDALEAQGVTFDEFRGLLSTEGDLKDADSFSDWDEIKLDVYERFAKDAKKLAKCIRIYGKANK